MVWLLPAGQGGFTVHRACLEDGHMYWLSSTSAALVTAASREEGLQVSRTMQQWRVVGIRLRGRENLSDGITVNVLGLRLVVGNVVLSLRPGGGDAFTRRLNEVRQKNKRRSTKKYLHTITKWLSYIAKESRVQIRFFLTLRRSLSCIVVQCWKIAFHLQVDQTQ